MAEMKSLNGYEIVDVKAREDIAELQKNSESGGTDLTGYATENWVHEQNFAPRYLAIRTLEKVTGDGYATADGDYNQIHPLDNVTYYGGIYDSYALRCELTGQGVTIKVPRIEVKTQAEYGALETKDETTIYIIKE